VRILCLKFVLPLDRGIYCITKIFFLYNTLRSEDFKIFFLYLFEAFLVSLSA
jgi:hypothetical protein